ncbi:MAG: SDR family oxidoreductase, partial [Acidimicrobiales bacterium]
MIKDQLAGKRIAVTGATGFLGTALVERLLRSAPDCELVLIVRPTRRSDPTRRIAREVLKNNAFNRLRQMLGDDFDLSMSRRIVTIAGDVAKPDLGLDDAGRAAIAGCDVFIHSAATVSFDSPLDASVSTNLLGPNNIVATLQDLGVTPHLIAVSTCYVAGSRRGDAAEEFLTDTPFNVEVDWRAEVKAAERTRGDVDAQSRSPEKLAKFHKQARSELGAAGTPLLAAKTEQLRAKWVNERMVDIGRARASSLGWPDVYTYSKALGETALIELRGNIPVTVVRPSIIESALLEPYPGWIRGFRMAEPIIISYAKGELHQFPGSPESVIDVIPVDIVANTIIAAAAEPPPAEPQVYQVASGSVNPLEYRVLTETVRRFFIKTPVYDTKGHPIHVPEWEFFGTTDLEGRLRLVSTGIRKADKTIAALPLRGKQNKLSERLQEQQRVVDQALGYVKIYGAYGRCEATYGIKRMQELRARMDASDQNDFCMDPTQIDWPTFIAEVHLPTVVEIARVKMSPGAKAGPSREERLRKQVLDPRRQFAAFDLENTLISSNVVESYVWLASRRLNGPDRARFVLRTILAGPKMLVTDARDRTDFLRDFYRRYEGAPVDQLDEDSHELLTQIIIAKSFPAAIRRVRAHREAGHRTVLITGALDLVVENLKPLFDDIVA